MFDVVEIEISPPHAQRVMAENLTEEAAEAFVKMAVIRRGVERHFYKAIPHRAPTSSDVAP